MRRFPFTDRLQSWCQLSLGQAPETATCVVRCIPRHLGEGGQGQSWYTACRCLHREVFEQRPSYTAACMIGKYRDWIDMDVAVDEVGDQIGRWPVGPIGTGGSRNLTMARLLRTIPWRKMTKGDPWTPTTWW